MSARSKREGDASRRSAGRLCSSTSVANVVCVSKDCTVGMSQHVGFKPLDSRRTHPVRRQSVSVLRVAKERSAPAADDTNCRRVVVAVRPADL